MEVLYRKENGRIKEAVFYERKVDSHVNVTIMTAYVDSEDAKAICNMDFPNKEAYDKYLNAIKAQLELYGWNSDYDRVVEAEFNMYEDGTQVGMFVDNVIDSVEGLTFPLYAYAIPKGKFVHFNNKFRTTEIISKIALDKALAVQDCLSTAFDCYVDGDNIIVADIAMLDNPYARRLKALEEVNVENVQIVNAVLINSIEELGQFTEDIVVRSIKGLYLPGESAKHTYILAANVYEDLMVLNTTNDNALCVDLSLNTVTTVQKEEQTVAQLIRYECKH